MQAQRFWLGALVTLLAVGGALAAGLTIDPEPRARIAADPVSASIWTDPSR
jgi:hypothetical protein